MMKKVNILLVIIMSFLSLSVYANGETLITLKSANEYFPTAVSLDTISKNYFRLFDSTSTRVGYMALTTPFSDDISGYSGPTPLLIVMDKSQKIVKVVMLLNNEDPSYSKVVVNAGLLDSWNGLTPEQALNKEVDAVTGATFTSYGITESMKVRLQNICDQKIEVRGPHLWVKNMALLVISFLGFLLFLFPRKLKRFRLPLLCLSLIVLGFWQSYMLSVAQIASWLKMGAPLDTQWGLVFVALVATVLPFFTGKSFYCEYICPFGAAQVLTSKITKRKIKISSRALGNLFIMRKVLFLIALSIFLFGLGVELNNYEPFTVFSYQTTSIVALIIAGVTIFLSLFIPRPWCRFACPIGMGFELVRKEGLKGRKKREN